VRETGEHAIVNWGYNAWGGKYPPFDLDDNIPGKVAADMMVEPDESDPNHQPLHENRKRLEQVFDVAELPMPCRIESDGQRLPASYANFLSVTRTSSIRRTATPTTSGRWVSCASASPAGRSSASTRPTDLIWGLGSFHYLTQQEPEAK